jgi:beta-mannosidase
MGDSHYWGVWHDEEPFEQYAKRVPRFMSEYGFQSFPEWKTIQSFTTTEDRGLETPVMNVHQKHPRGNTLMRKYMAREYHVPEKFEDFTYVSQIVQAEGIRRGVEAHRRAKPYCMGTLYWQLNDVWPVASWSSIDGLGNWKALHYAVKKAFSPLLLSMSEQDGFLSLILTNDFLSAYKDAKLKVQLIDFQGNEVFQTTESVALLNPNANTTIFQTTTAKLLHGKSSKSHYALFTLIVDNKILSCLNYYFECPKKLSLTKEKLNPTIEQIGTQYHVTFRSETLIKNLFLQTEAKGKWQENYVDLLPNESKTIIFDYKEGVFEASLQWKCLNDFAK